MRVFYDTSVLGFASVEVRARTGIWRVTEQLANALLGVEECELVFMAAQHSAEARRYLQKHPLLSKVPFTYGRRKAARLWLDERIEGGRKPAPPRPLLRATRRTMRLLDSAVRPALPEPMAVVSAMALKPSAVYHSTLYAIPPEVRSIPGMRAIQTIYDVIPLIRPDLFSWGGERMIRGILDGLLPDDHIVCISQATKDDLLGVAPDLKPDQVSVTHLAADPELFHPIENSDHVEAVRARYGIPEGPYVLCLGTLEPRKNVPHLIRSFARLIESEPNCDLNLVLTGTKGWDYEPIFAEVARQPRVRERIHFSGYVADADLAPLYAGATVFTYPSLYEGFGLPPLEAMLCGTPVVTSNSSSLPEVVGDAGIMVPPLDGDALSQALLDVSRNAELRRDLSQRALARSRTFSWDRCARETTSAYRAAL